MLDEILDEIRKIDPDPRIAAILAIASIDNDLLPGAARTALRGVLPHYPDEHLDELLDQIAGEVQEAITAWETIRPISRAEWLRDWQLGSAAGCAAVALGVDRHHAPRGAA